VRGGGDAKEKKFKGKKTNKRCAYNQIRGILLRKGLHRTMVGGGGGADVRVKRSPLNKEKKKKRKERKGKMTFERKYECSQND